MSVQKKTSTSQYQGQQGESLVRQNFNDDSERAINDQINFEFYACYLYESMGYYFDRDDKALYGFKAFFMNKHQQEKEHALTLMKYLNKRGGRVVLRDIKAPEQTEWENGLKALQFSLDIEKRMYQALCELHSIAEKNNDKHLEHFIEDVFLDDQINAIKLVADLITQLQRAGPNDLGEYQFDKDLRRKFQ